MTAAVTARDVKLLLFSMICLLTTIGDLPAQQPNERPAQQPNERPFKTKPDDREATVREIRLDDLPEPPQAIAELIKRGKVRLITGGGVKSDQSSLAPNGRLAGETRFTFRFRYDSHAVWRVERGRAGRDSASAMVLIQVRFRTVKLLQSHDVWIRQPPLRETFWDNAIVRHEFDHVQISSHPQVEKLFRDSVKKLERIRVPLSTVSGRNGRIEKASVTALIESRMDAILKETTEYVRIRYRELDRLTLHGMRPLPKDTDLIELK